MKLFISYSREDKAWVYEFWRALRDDAGYDVWIDRRIVPAENWWGTICENIESCDCFIAVLTPDSVQSIYCCAELDYAHALNKPILPLMLKPCDIPQAIIGNQIQYADITNDTPMDRVLILAMTGLRKVEKRLTQGLHPPKEATRPALPTPNPRNSKQIKEVVELAEEAREANHLLLTEELLEQLIAADPKGEGVAASEKLTRIQDVIEVAAEASSKTKEAANPISSSSHESIKPIATQTSSDSTTNKGFIILATVMVFIVLVIPFIRGDIPSLADLTTTSGYATYLAPTDTAIASDVRATIQAMRQAGIYAPDVIATYETANNLNSQADDPLVATATALALIQVGGNIFEDNNNPAALEETRIARDIRSTLPTILECEKPVESEITPNNNSLEYTLFLSIGQSLQITGEPVGDYLQLSLTLIDPLGNEIAADQDLSRFPSIRTGTLSSSGLYTIVASAPENTMGFFSLSVECYPAYTEGFP